jgi:hypothetical protein
MNQESQGPTGWAPAQRWQHPPPRGLIVPNPKLKLLDQVREVMRLKHYSIRTEQCYSDWIKRYIHFHRLKAREELSGDAEAKMETLLRVIDFRETPGTMPKPYDVDPAVIIVHAVNHAI